MAREAAEGHGRSAAFDTRVKVWYRRGAASKILKGLKRAGYEPIAKPRGFFVSGHPLIAAGMGLFYQKPGQPFSYTNLRGETVMINGLGLIVPLAILSAEALWKTRQQFKPTVRLGRSWPLAASKR